MFFYSQKFKKNVYCMTAARFCVCLLSISLALAPMTVEAQTVFNLPVPGTMVMPSTTYSPAVIAGITINPQNPLQMDFIIDTGEEKLQGEAFEAESRKLINYFLSSLTVPDEEMWVNLSPYEKDRIIADGLSETEMGRDLLTQDYLLKQLTASLMYPEEEIGEEFWKRVYEKVEARFGTTQIPTNTFNKVWIVPQRAAVYVNGNSAFVSDSHLKVMLEEDYLTLEANIGSAKHGLGEMTKNDIEQMSEEAKQAVREVLIPEIEREVNEGKHFAQLRQIYHAAILAAWYKENLKTSILNKVYVGTNKTDGIALAEKDAKEKVYNQYLKAFKKGVFNYIREDVDSKTNVMTPRKYFSGGVPIGKTRKILTKDDSIANSPILSDYLIHGNDPVKRADLRRLAADFNLLGDNLKAILTASQLDEQLQQAQEVIVPFSEFTVLTSQQIDALYDIRSELLEIFHQYRITQFSERIGDLKYLEVVGDVANLRKFVKDIIFRISLSLNSGSKRPIFLDISKNPAFDFEDEYALQFELQSQLVAMDRVVSAAASPIEVDTLKTHIANFTFDGSVPEFIRLQSRDRVQKAREGAIDMVNVMARRFDEPLILSDVIIETYMRDHFTGVQREENPEVIVFEAALHDFEKKITAASPINVIEEYKVGGEALRDRVRRNIAAVLQDSDHTSRSVILNTIEAIIENVSPYDLERINKDLNLNLNGSDITKLIQDKIDSEWKRIKDAETPSIDEQRAERIADDLVNISNGQNDAAQEYEELSKLLRSHGLNMAELDVIKDKLNEAGKAISDFSALMLLSQFYKREFENWKARQRIEVFQVREMEGQEAGSPISNVIEEYKVGGEALRDGVRRNIAAVLQDSDHTSRSVILNTIEAIIENVSPYDLERINEDLNLNSNGSDITKLIQDKIDSEWKKILNSTQETSIQDERASRIFVDLSKIAESELDEDTSLLESTNLLRSHGAELADMDYIHNYINRINAGVSGLEAKKLLSKAYKQEFENWKARQRIEVFQVREMEGQEAGSPISQDEAVRRADMLFEDVINSWNEAGFKSAKDFQKQIEVLHNVLLKARSGMTGVIIAKTDYDEHKISQGDYNAVNMLITFLHQRKVNKTAVQDELESLVKNTRFDETSQRVKNTQLAASPMEERRSEASLHIREFLNGPRAEELNWHFKGFSNSEWQPVAVRLIETLDNAGGNFEYRFSDSINWGTKENVTSDRVFDLNSRNTNVSGFAYAVLHILKNLMIDEVNTLKSKLAEEGTFFTNQDLLNLIVRLWKIQHRQLLNSYYRLQSILSNDASFVASHRAELQELVAQIDSLSLASSDGTATSKLVKFVLDKGAKGSDLLDSKVSVNNAIKSGVLSEGSIITVVTGKNEYDVYDLDAVEVMIFGEYDRGEDAIIGEDGEIVILDGYFNILIENESTIAASPIEKKVGGIDLNPDIMDLEFQGEAAHFKFDESLIQAIQPQNVHGILPVIINITPITNLPLLLGMRENEENTEISSL